MKCSKLGIMSCLYFLVAILAAYSLPAQAANHATLNAINYLPLSADKMRVELSFNAPVSAPQSFVSNQPARLVLDFKGVVNRLSSTAADQSNGIFEKMTAVEDDSRTRVIFDLKRAVEFKASAEGNKVILTVKSKAATTAATTSPTENLSAITPRASAHSIRNIDFKPSEDGTAKILIDLSDSNMGVDIANQGKKIVLAFADTTIPVTLKKDLDVKEFNTPVQAVDAKSNGNNASIVIETNGNADHVAYQVDKQFVVDVRPLNANAIGLKSKRNSYIGKRISLNFQDIKVRAVLQLLSDFTGLNMVVSDTVQGNITIRLKNVPWDEALEIILRTRGLDKRQVDNVLLIAPSLELAAQEKADLARTKDLAQLEPLRSELIQINYAKASELATLLKEKSHSLLTERGNVSVDGRTNTLWIQDTPKKVREVKDLVRKLDIPVQQVLIETRIVVVDKNFEQDIGIQWGFTKPNHLTGTLAGANTLAGGVSSVTTGTTTAGGSTTTTTALTQTAPGNPANVPLAERLNLALPAIPTSGLQPASVGLAIAKLGGDVLLDLELSALESEGRGEVISSPRLITANQQAAHIESGQEIPYQESTSSGATSVSFKKAVLSLQVTPQITPDNKVVLAIEVHQDTPSVQLFQNVPAILTKQMQTNVLVDNGQTVVMGGIYTQTKNKQMTRIPFLGSLPVVGILFRNTVITNNREELLIFVTPKVIKQAHLSGYG